MYRVPFVHLQQDAHSVRGISSVMGITLGNISYSNPMPLQKISSTPSVSLSASMTMTSITTASSMFYGWT